MCFLCISRHVQSTLYFGYLPCRGLRAMTSKWLQSALRSLDGRSYRNANYYYFLGQGKKAITCRPVIFLFLFYPCKWMWIEDSSNYTDGMEKGFPTSLGLSVIFILYSLRVFFEVASLILTWCNLCLRKSLKCLGPRLERQSMEGSFCTYPVPIFFPSTTVIRDT